MVKCKLTIWFPIFKMFNQKDQIVPTIGTCNMTLRRFIQGLLIHTPYVKVISSESYKIHNLIKLKKLRIFLKNPKNLVHFVYNVCRDESSYSSQVLKNGYMMAH